MSIQPEDVLAIPGLVKVVYPDDGGLIMFFGTALTEGADPTIIGRVTMTRDMAIGWAKNILGKLGAQ
jgi:hypothetical protein